MKVFSSLSCAVLAAAAVCGGYWIAGFNFDERTPQALSCYVFSVIAAGSVFCMAMAFQTK